MLWAIQRPLFRATALSLNGLALALDDVVDLEQLWLARLYRDFGQQRHEALKPRRGLARALTSVIPEEPDRAGKGAVAKDCGHARLIWTSITPRWATGRLDTIEEAALSGRPLRAPTEPVAAKPLRGDGEKRPARLSRCIGRSRTFTRPLSELRDSWRLRRGGRNGAGSEAQ